MSEIVKYYEPELNLIENSGIREAVELMLNRAPKYYMTVNAASNARYSKDRDGNILKLKDHTKAVVRYVLKFLTHQTIRYQFTADQRDYMVGAALVHDLVKFGLDDTPSKYIMFEHPILIAQLVQDYTQMNPQLSEHICRIVNIAVAHNGPWNTSQKSDTVLPEVTDNMQWYVHLADWLSSRNTFWVDISDKSIGDFTYEK